MSTSPKLYRKRFLPLLILAMLVNILAQTVHETGHHLVYQGMGHDPVWACTKIVQLTETTPTNPEEWTAKHTPMVQSVAGPLAGLFGAVLGLVMVRRSGKVTSKQAWLTFALTTSLVAVLYYLHSPTRTGGDEYDIAMQFEVAKSLIEIPLALGFATCLVLGLRMFPSWGIRLKWLGTILLGSIATGLLMALLDPAIISQVDAGNPRFQPVIGYSLPVFLTIVILSFSVWAWSRWQDGISHEKIS